MRKRILYFILLMIVSVFLCMDEASDGTIKFSKSVGYLIQHAGEVEEDIYAEHFVLEPGVYHIVMNYTSSEADNYLAVRNYGVEQERVYFNPESNELKHILELEEATCDLELAAHYMGKGYLEVKDFYMEAEQEWYHDSWLRVAMLWAAVMVIGLLRRKKVNTDIWIVLGIAVLSSTIFLSDNRIGFGDDLRYHLTRIEGIAQGLRNGQFPVMIYPEVEQGRGYLNAMYPSLFLYIPAVLRLCGVSFTMAYKALLILINFATAFSMYFAMKQLTDERKITLLATLLYVFMRYRLSNMLVRHALGETLAIVFAPLVLAGLYQIVVGNQKRWWILVLGATGLIQSHILSAVIYVVICLIVICCFAGRIIKEKRYLELAKAISLILLLNMWFVIPFMAFYIKGNLNLDALTGMTYWHESLNPSYVFGIFDTFREDSDYARDYALRLPLVCLSGIAAVYLLQKKDKKSEKDSFFTVLFVTALIMLYMVTNWFPYRILRENEAFDGIFSFLQFPWRLVAPAATIIIMAGSIWIMQIEGLYRYASAVVTALAVMVLMDTAVWDLKWEDNICGYEDRFEQYEYRTILTDKVRFDMAYCPSEYFVEGDYSKMQETAWADEGIELLDYKKQGTTVELKYQASNSDKKAKIHIPVWNYIGYRASDEMEKVFPIETGEAGNVSVAVECDGEQHTIRLEYREPWLFRMGEVISVGTVLGLIIYIGLEKKRKS